MTRACPYTREADTVMSNFDHAIDHTVAAYLKAEECFAPYTGANFFGRVWWDRDASRWKCEVLRHHEPVEVVEAETLEAIMSDVCAKYGSE